jgi:hypothetical protein
MTILRMYSYQFPSLSKNIMLCFSTHDRELIVNSVLTHCNTLWSTLRRPSSLVFRKNAASMLALIDSFILSYLSHSLPNPALYDQFKRPSSPAKPSISHQITNLEITIDPYYKSLQRNFYFPISPDNMPTADDTPMSIDNVDQPNSQPPSNSSISSLKKSITVEDSMDVIAELIQEIQNSDDQDISSQISLGTVPPMPVTNKRVSIRVSLAKRNKSGVTAPSSLPLLRKFFHILLSTGQTSILPVRNESKISPIKSTAQVNELTLVGAKSFHKASKPNSHCIAGDYHLSTSLSFDELSGHPKVLDWLYAHGYFLILSDCQSSDKIKIGFLTRVRPFTWREDLRDEIKASNEWQENPFQFRLFFGSISSNKKGEMAPVLMVEVERDKVSLGLAFFSTIFAGDTPLSPCGIPYIFFTLYQNILSDTERISIIRDINHHVGHYQLIRLYGLKNIDTIVTLRQNVKIKLRKLLLNIRAHQSSSSMFTQIEKEADPDSILCAFDSDQYDTVMANIPNISLYIRQCLQDDDLQKVFVNPDYSIYVPQRLISSQKGIGKPKTIPIEIQEHTTAALSKMIKVTKRVSPTSSVSSYSNASTAPSPTANSTTTSPTSRVSSPQTACPITASQPSNIDNRFRLLETRIESSNTRMDNIEQLCRQLKNNTDVISQNIQQLALDFYSSRQTTQCRLPATKSQRLSVD